MLKDLYQDLILDHGRAPRNHVVLNHATHSQEGYNPLCGDRVTVYLFEQQNVISDVSFTGEGCAICMASASLMTGALKGLSIEDAKALFDDFHATLMNADLPPSAQLGKLAALRGVSRYPMRVKCATLPWHTLLAALGKTNQPVSTE